jgi:hypothetical protein
VTDDPFPRWPPDWVEDHELEVEEVVEPGDGLELVSAVRDDGRVMLTVGWPGGRRYLIVEPVGLSAPEALRIGEPAEDPELARAVEGLWSGALKLAKQLVDGEVPVPAPPSGGRRRPWRRGQG